MFLISYGSKYSWEPLRQVIGQALAVTNFLVGFRLPARHPLHPGQVSLVANDGRQFFEDPSDCWRGHMKQLGFF